MSILIRDAGVWKESAPSVRDGGVWKPVDTGYVRDGGLWKEAYTSFTPSHLLTVGYGGSGQRYGYAILFGTWGGLSPITVTVNGVSYDIYRLGATVDESRAGIAFRGVGGLYPPGWRPIITYNELGSFPIVEDSGTQTNRSFKHTLSDSNTIFAFLAANVGNVIGIHIE